MQQVFDLILLNNISKNTSVNILSTFFLVMVTCLLLVVMIRFHELTEFDEAKRSCRRRLAGHNERRRKSSAECQGESTSRKGSAPQSKESHCRQLVEDQRSRIQMAPPGSSGYKHLHIR